MQSWKVDAKFENGDLGLFFCLSKEYVVESYGSAKEQFLQDMEKFSELSDLPLTSYSFSNSEIYSG